MSHVFISYEKTDKAVAETICRYLEEQGLQCWMAPRNVLAGKKWDESIDKAIETSSCVVLVFSAQADASRQVKREVALADTHEVPIIPCRIKNVAPSKLRYYLTDTHWFDAFEPPLEHHLPQLLTTITSHVPDVQVKPPVAEPRPSEPPPPEPPPTAKVEAPPEKEFTNSLGMTFVLIPAGTFMMGSPEGESGRSDDEQQHQVTISRPFYLQTTPVTQGQWQRVMDKNPSYFKDCGEDCPVEQVSWIDVQGFLRKLNQMENTDTYRLPTEAEWEYACRAESTGRWCFGDNEADLGKYAWYDVNSQGKTHPVSQLKPNAWGLYDMHGNVWEWCQDWYGEYPRVPVTDPHGPDNGKYRVLRGGSWFNLAWGTRSAGRCGFNPDDRYSSIGFRVARAL